jgi:hypothetical protein
MFIAIVIVAAIFLIPAFLLFRYWQKSESEPGGSWGDQLLDEDQQPK